MHPVDVLRLQVRDEELDELDQMLSNYCELPAAGGVENSYGKINILLQTYISRGEVDSFSLISDLSYVAQVRTGRKQYLTATDESMLQTQSQTFCCLRVETPSHVVLFPSPVCSQSS